MEHLILHTITVLLFTINIIAGVSNYLSKSFGLAALSAFATGLLIGGM